MLKGSDILHETIEQLHYYFNRIIEHPEAKAAFATVMLILSELFGDFSKAAQILVIVLVVDLILGIAKSIKRGNLCSTKARAGIRKLFEYLIIILLAYQLERLVVEGLRELVLFWLCFTEMTSIVENLEELGMNVPPFLRQVIEREKDNISDDI